MLSKAAAAPIGADSFAAFVRRCTTQLTKGFEIEFRAVLTAGGAPEVRFERVVR
jgi:hypothetical protein